MTHRSDLHRSADPLILCSPLDLSVAYNFLPYWKLPLVGERLDGGEQVVGRITGAVDRIIEEHHLAKERWAADAAQSEPPSEPTR